MSLTRDELERRLEYTYGDKVNGDETAWEREELLQTALAAMDERDEILTAKKRDSQMAVSYYSKYQEAIAERDALLAENRLLRDSLALVDDIDGWHLASNVRIALESAFLPRTAAEAERVKRLEAVLEAADEYRDAEQVQMLNEFKYDEPKYERQRRAKAALDAAIAAYREGERPGGEDRETDGLA